MAANGRRSRHEIREQKVWIGEHVADRVIITLFDGARLAVDRQQDVGCRRELFILVDVLVPECEVVRRKRLAVRPAHALPQVQNEGAAPVQKLVAPGYVWPGRFTRVVPEQQAIRAGDGAVAVPPVTRPSEASAPGTTILANLVDWLDDERLIRQALLDWRQLALLDQVGQHRRLAERLGKLSRVDHDARPFELADELAAWFGGGRSRGRRRRWLGGGSQGLGRLGGRRS